MLRSARTAWLAILPVAVLQAADGVVLRHQFQPQSKYEQSVTVRSTARLEMDALPPAMAEQAQAFLGKDITSDMTLKVAFVTAARESDGSLPFEAQLTQFDGRVVLPGMGEMALPAPKLDQAFRGKLAAGGRGLEMDLASMSGELPRELVDRLSLMMPEFPPEPLHVGEKFDMRQKMELPIPSLPGGKLALDSLTTFKLASIGDREALFDVVGSLSMAGGDAAAEDAIKVAGGSRGTAAYDLAQGLITRIELEIDARVDMDIAKFAAAGTSPAPAPLKMAMTLRGDVECGTTKLPQAN